MSGNLATPSLLPCPMCGEQASIGTNVVNRQVDDRGTYKSMTGYSVNCISCGVNNRTIAEGHKTPLLAAERWNRRVLASAGAEYTRGRADGFEAGLLKAAQMVEREADACHPGSPAEKQNWPAAFMACALKIRKAAEPNAAALADPCSSALCRECRPSGRCIRDNPVYQQFAERHRG